VNDLIRETCSDIISFSESKNADFSLVQLQALDPWGKFAWNWLTAKNIAGGILVGISKDLFDIGRWDV
jgi:hypothetical protein